MRSYEHRQIGYVTTLGILAGIILMTVVATTQSEFNAVYIAVFVILLAALSIFSSLTVIIEDKLEVRFGLGFLRKRFDLNEIASAKTVKLAWYYGWGIRMSPHGWIFRVSGSNAVEVTLTSGRRYFIGTDAPQELEIAINQAVSQSKSV